MSEHVHCVAVTFKVTEQVEQRICLRFCIKLEHSSAETIRMIQKATATGSCDGQLHQTMRLLMHHVSCRGFWQITQVTQPPYSPDLAPCDFWLFPKLRSPLKGRFQTVDETQENMMRQLVDIQRTV